MSAVLYQGMKSVVTNVLWAPFRALHELGRIIVLPFRRRKEANKTRQSAQKDGASHMNFHLRILGGFWRLLGKYNMRWRFCTIIVTSLVLESFAPLVIFNLISAWEQALIEKNMDLLWSLLRSLVVSEGVLAVLNNTVIVMWRYLLGGLAQQNRQESTNAILTDKGIDLYVGNSAEIDNAPQTIMQECINFMQNFIPLYINLIRTVTFIVVGAMQLYAAGLGLETLGIILATTSVVKLAGAYSQTFDNANSEEFQDTSRSLNLLVGLRGEKNLHTFPNARKLVGTSIKESNDAILKNQTTRYRLTGAISAISDALKKLADPLLTIFVLARVYFTAGSTMTYATFGGLIQVATSLSWSIVGWADVGEWWSKLFVNLQNIERVQKNLVDKAKEEPSKRLHRDGLYAEGAIQKDSKGLGIDFCIKKYPSAETFRTFASCNSKGIKQQVWANKGDYILVVGHNGAGKTTMLNAVAKAIPNVKKTGANKDYVVLQVGQQTDIPAYIRNTCQSLVQQQRSLWAFICYHWPHVIEGVNIATLKEANVLPGKDGELVAKANIEKDVYENLTKLSFKPEYGQSLSKEVHKYFHMNPGQGLSGGEVKKLFTAAFLAIAKHAKVDVLILDEVTAGLDASSLDAFQSIMNTFKSNNREMIFFEVFHRTDSTSKGLNQNGKKIWSIGSNKGTLPAIQQFDNYQAFARWAQNQSNIKTQDVSPTGDGGWLEYWFINKTGSNQPKVTIK